MNGMIINLVSLSWVLGSYLAIMAFSMLLPLMYAMAWDNASVYDMQLSFSITLGSSLLLLWSGRNRESRSLRDREIIVLVVGIWLLLCLFGALPFYFSTSYASFTDAYFEAVSGFTTTGATVLADVEALRPAMHLWRAFSHWLGGLGIVVLGLAVLPLLSQGAESLYRVEFSGASARRMRPRIQEIARSLWSIYFALTILMIIALKLAGMNTLDAICHAFSTLGTGGFSTRTDSIAAFHSPLIEYIHIVFMLLAGISFIQHYRLWVQREVTRVFADYEVRAFLFLVGLATLVISIQLKMHQSIDSEAALRHALFQVVSISTTTGFISNDYAQWSPLAQLILLVLMFIGGCTGSTAGGLKVARAVLLWRVISREFSRISEPQGIFRIHLGDEVISEPTVNALLNLVYLAWAVLLGASLVLAATGLDILTAISAVIACQFNIGPGLGGVGPVENYGDMTDLAKWTLSFCMIAGRLEFYTLLVVLTRRFWRQ